MKGGNNELVCSANYSRMVLENIIKFMDDIDAISWSLIVRELRQRLNLSQERLAQQLGVSFQTVNRWETGKVNPSPMATQLIKKTLIDLGKDGQDLLDQYLILMEMGDSYAGGTRRSFVK